MITFDLTDNSGIFIFTLHNYRKGEGRTYTSFGSVPKRLNSYALFNTDTEEVQILNYDSIRASTFDNSIFAFTIKPGERFIGLKGTSWYYINHNGQEIGYAGDYLFWKQYPVSYINNNIFDNQDTNVQSNNQVEDDDSSEKSNFIIDGNKIIHDNGDLYESDYLLKERINDVIICYKEIDINGNYKKNIFGICDSRANLLSEVKYDNIWASNNPIRNKYIRVKIQDKFGLISFEGKEILPVIYDYIDDCDGNIAIVNHGKKLINIHNLAILFETEGRILKIVDGWMKVVEGYSATRSLGLLDSNGIFYEFYNKKNHYLEKEMYETLGASFHDGLLPVYLPSKGFGYVDIDSNEIIECKYCEISDFKDGKAKVRLDCEYGYINTEGCMIVEKDGKEIAIPKKYDWAYDYQNGYFVVLKGKLYGAIDDFMHEIIPCAFTTKEEVDLTYSKISLHNCSSLDADYEEKYLDLLPPIRFEENRLVGFKSANGILIFPPVLYVGKFVEGMAIISLYGKLGYINEKLELVIKPKYDSAEDFSEGLALVHEIGEGYMFINKLGDVVISCDYHQEKIGSFKNGVARCEYNRSQPGRDNEDDIITKYCIGYKITW